ncbi:hypothetical protein C2S52_012740 [Perilla frutescens var. hirtella]|nr:hypothetical protein C2S52_012740 [Perilla frutescens var. hirtella]
MEILEQNLDELFDLNPFLAEIYSNYGGATAATTDNHELKMSSINCWNGQLETLISPSSSMSMAAAVEAPQLISFEKEEKYFSSFSPTNNYNADCNSLLTSSQIISFSPSAEDDDHFGKKERVSRATRTPSQAQEHVMAERKRRQNLGQLFIALSKVVPGLKKLDKASLLEDAINYLKALQERVTALEKEDKAVSSKNVHVEDITSFPSPSDSSCELPHAEISVRISDKHVLVKICCKKQMGLMSRIPSELERMNLSVIDMRIMPFGGAALDVTILAEMQSGFMGTVKEIVDHLQAVLGTATQI